MGYSSNWFIVDGLTPKLVWDRLRVRPTGERSDRPDFQLVGAVRPDGAYLVVEDRAQESVEWTWNFAELSVDCVVTGAGEVDGAGGAEVVRWREGRKEWGIAAPMGDGGPDISGDVPAEILDAVEQTARELDEETPDYFNAILRLATALTGYRCGSAIAPAGSLPFENLDTSRHPEVEALEPTTPATARSSSAADDVARRDNSTYVGYTWSEGRDRNRYSSPERSVEYALISVGVLLAPDSFLASGIADLVFQTYNFEGDVRDRYPELADAPSRERYAFSRAAILAGLRGKMWGVDQFLVWVDPQADANTLDDELWPLPTRPAMSWDRNPIPVRGPMRHPADAESYLREVARQSREAGMALTRISRTESYGLCFVPLERTPLLLADAVVAGFTQENDCALEVVEP
ncbi:hypothetical protein ACWIGI_22040 [Nocardia sp. NPDC055321]